MFMGLQGTGPFRLKWTFRITIFLCYVFLTFYAIWALNNLAMILTAVDLDRYVSLDFWRLGLPFLALYSPPLTILLLFNNLRIGKFYPYMIHCIFVASAIVVEGTWFVWLVIDLVNCATTVYCIGNGVPVLGIDLGLIVAAFTQGVMMFLNFVFLFINFYVRRKVQLRNLADIYSNPNRQPIPSDPGMTLSGNIYSTGFINSNMNETPTNTKFNPNDVKLEFYKEK